MKTRFVLTLILVVLCSVCPPALAQTVNCVVVPDRRLGLFSNGGIGYEQLLTI